MIRTFIAALSLFVLVTGSRANERRFAFTYETMTASKGTFEFEEQVLWERGSGFDTFLFRQELEYGITDRLQLAVYFFDFEHAKEEGASSTKWAGTGLEAIYQMTDPNKSSIGSALYGEALMNDSELELEAKLLLQKNLGPFIIAWNGILEAKWEDGYQQAVGVLEQTIGVSYQIRPAFSVGFEAKQEVAFEDWSHSEGNAVFVGPNVSFRKGRFFAAATCLFRVTNVPGEPHLELGTVFGFHF
jgi:hypothetical protein